MSLPPAVILAGGLSSRMGGGDKGLLAPGGRSLIDRVIGRIAPQAGALALNANGDAARFEAFGLPVIADSMAGHPGPLAGVLAAMDWAARAGQESVVTVAADTPFFPPDLVARLQRAAAEAGTPLALAATPRPGGGLSRHPTFGLWHTGLRDDLRAALEDGLRKVVLWTDAQGCATASFDVTSFDPFFNVNTPDDMAEAERMIAEFGL
ncbi:molybdenum cofactor guanylyltransferase MobA [Oceanicella sp. SM1341]|uniref:molybdenum cofactor guanylyltransferase MobA n=1 Tax=Oceanicella sp. SM1341 TaxID=1548889 RepID=UPI000E54078E|nr:molybdenum cofactor guanylyltransferase MobA [Oceanicella sp. SM1341]